MYKNVLINSATTQAVIGNATKARIRMKDGALQVRFSDRTSLVNLPKDEAVVDLYVKSNSRRIGLKSAFTETLEVGGKIALIPGKYGWFTMVPANADNIAGSVSAR